MDTCAVCDRAPGHMETDRFGDRDANPNTPLGSLEHCSECGLVVCPDCLQERECCEQADEEE